MRVLVVCTANVARSPLAAAMLAARLGPDVAVASAGVRAREGLVAAAESQRLAAERGLDVAGHRSRAVGAELLADADLVLTMSRRQRDHCQSRVAGGAATTFTLPELVRLVDEDGAPRAPTRQDAAHAEDAPVDIAEGLAALARRAHLARPRARPVGDADDVADPIGLDWPAWQELGTRLDRLVWRLARAAREPAADPAPPTQIDRW